MNSVLDAGWSMQRNDNCEDDISLTSSLARDFHDYKLAALEEEKRELNASSDDSQFSGNSYRPVAVVRPIVRPVVRPMVSESGAIPNMGAQSLADMPLMPLNLS